MDLGRGTTAWLLLLLDVMKNAAMTRVARGLVAGTAATGAMSAAMFAFKGVGAMGRMPPQVITDAALIETGALQATPPELRKPVRRVSATLMHFGFGAAMGALFEGVRGTFARKMSRAGLYVSSTLFGLSVWAVSYAGWVPALRIMPPPQHDRPGRPTSMVLAHVVFGAAMAGALRLLGRSRRFG